MKGPQVKLARRKFLFAAAAGGVAATAAVVATTHSHQSALKPRARADRTGSGYQLTEHVRNYYRTTRI
jgi:hypothetical protein